MSLANIPPPPTTAPPCCLFSSLAAAASDQSIDANISVNFVASSVFKSNSTARAAAAVATGNL